MEYLPIIDETGAVVGKATRAECHSGTFLLHPVVHLHVFDPQGRLYLQKRSLDKDIQPGKWDTAVGGHVDYGEAVPDALLREAAEELSLRGFEPEFVVRYKFVSAVEAEMVHVFRACTGAQPVPDPAEISEGRFWTQAEIRARLGTGLFTPNFEQEFVRYASLLFA